ncbi:MAG: hypothetical protein KBS99_09080 [Prevotellaceae bacterium]|nr:hypothetical protein [Candidatus Colivivens caballi]
MKTDEIDKIIAEALEADKHPDSHRRHNGRSLTSSRSSKILTARKVLNTVFIIGFIAAVVIYFALPDQRMLFFCVGFGSMLIKIVEFFLRFMF